MMHSIKQRNDNAHVIRNALFQTGQKIQREAIQALHQAKNDPSDQNRQSLLRKLGQLEGYIHSRRSVSPFVAIDVALQEQQGLANKITHWLNDKRI